jgi:hypothetical protein
MHTLVLLYLQKCQGITHYCVNAQCPPSWQGILPSIDVKVTIGYQHTICRYCSVKLVKA